MNAKYYKLDSKIMDAVDVELEKDIFDLALQELVRTGRILVSKDAEGRPVYTLARN